MKDYVNKFAVAVSGERTEVMISFVQESPDLTMVNLPQPGEGMGTIPSRTQQETVAELIMSEKSARRLAEIILSTLERGSGKRPAPLSRN